MAPVTNGKAIFAEIPTGYPELGKTIVYDGSEQIDLNTAPLSGGVLFKTICLSLDPYMRGLMRDPKISSYAPAFVVGEPLKSAAVAVVLRSENSTVRPGEYYRGIFEHKEFNIIPESALGSLKKLDSDKKVPWSWYLGILGTTGRSAYMPWKEFSQAKAGQTVYVTTGAGPVGSVVIQLAKMDGMKVISSTSSAEKVKWMKECGADVAFNYKEEDTAEVLRKEGPIDVYWDNVGGPQLEAALDAAKIGARFIECGMITDYNGTPYHVKNLTQIVGKGIHLHGFIIGRDLIPKWESEYLKDMVEKIEKGEFKVKEDVTKGLENVGEAFLGMLEGKNVGKVIIQVSESS